jgi:hypothetical protein
MMRALQVLLLVLLSACAPVNIRGTVFAGEVGIIAAVPADDARLKKPGLSGVKVRVLQTGRSGAVVERTTDEKGRFSVPLEGTGALGSPMTIEASLAGHAFASESMPTPTQNTRILIMLQPLRRPAP